MTKKAIGVAKWLLAGFVFVALTLVIYLNLSSEDDVDLEEVMLGGVSIKVEVVETKAELIKGLSGRSAIGPADGMLFVFSDEDRHGIWMKDMKFAIDIIWINSGGEVVAILEDVSPDTYPKVFRPQEPASYVLETEAGMIKENNWSEGDDLLRP
ncbi:MAG: DUF192 domain-containing protein [Candidatus Paceibacterota bacterium]